MALLAIYFGWASVMAIFAAHIAAFYLTDNLFIFLENWLAMPIVWPFRLSPPLW